MDILGLNSISIVFICLALASIAYYEGLLNVSGTIAAFLIALFIGYQGGLPLVFLLVIFLFSSFLATRYKFPYKKERGIQQGLEGERGWTNVLANGAVPTFVLLIASSPLFGGIGLIRFDVAILLFVGSVAAAASDTLASEMGMVSDKVHLIINFKKVEPGTNGGISLYGEMWAFIGAAYTFLVAQAVFYISSVEAFSLLMTLLGISIAFMSCQIDSILGASLERKGLMGKSMVNLSAISISITIFGGILWLLAY